MKTNNNIWIVIVILLLFIFMIQPKEKKEAGEIIKFRTSDPTYSSGYIAFNTVNPQSCSGENIDKHNFVSGLGYSLIKCTSIYGTPIIENIPNIDVGCEGTSNLHYFADTNSYIVCCNKLGGGRINKKYSADISGTEPSISTDPSREINCAVQSPPPTNPYNLFIDAKTSYVNGGAFPEFVTKANEWVTSQ